jgi:hypothetical protein
MTSTAAWGLGAALGQVAWSTGWMLGRAEAWPLV